MSSKRTRSRPEDRASSSQTVAAASVLTPEEMHTVKGFIKALIVYRKQNDSPSEYKNWAVLEDFLKTIYNKVRSLYISQTKNSKTLEYIKKHIAKMPYKHEAEKKWRDICLTFIISHETLLWKKIVKDVKSAFESIQFVIEYPLENIMGDGYMRNSVFKDMELKEILTFFTGKTYKNDLSLNQLKEVFNRLSEQQLDDITLQLNDGSSAVFTELFHLCKYSDMDSLNKLKLFIDIFKKFDINTVTSDGRHIFSELIYNFVDLIIMNKYSRNEYGRELFYFIKNLWSNFDIHVSAICYTGNSFRGYKPIRIVGYLLLCAFNQPLIWELLQMILQKIPLRELYDDTIKEHGNVYAVNIDGAIIDNIWIIRKYPPSHVDWLIEHGGMDPYNSGSRKQSLRRSLHALRDTSETQIPKFTTELTQTQQSIVDMLNNIRQMRQTVEQLQIQESIDRKNLTNAQRDFLEYQQASASLEDVFAKHKIGGRKPKHS